MVDFKDYRDIVDNINDGVYFVDINKNITYWNKAAEEKTGFSMEEVVGCCCSDNILNHVDDDFNQLCLCGCPLEKTLKDGLIRNESVYLHHKDGHRVKIKTRVIPVYENNEIVGAFEVFTDESESEYITKTLEKLKKAALTDHLTGIPNRRYIETRMDSFMSEYKTLGIKFGLVFFDIDNFRNFNNNYGHDVGDEALKTVTKSLINIVTKKDMIGRYGGEEFILVFSDVDDIKELTEKAEKVRGLVATSELRHNHEKLKITISVGATIVNEDDTVESIIKRADEFMYESKKAGKNRVTAN